jgi:hypothetical protein
MTYTKPSVERQTVIGQMIYGPSHCDDPKNQLHDICIER